MKVKAKLIVDIETEYTDDPQNDAETLRFCVEEDLKDMGYVVEEVTVVEGTEVIEFDNPIKNDLCDRRNKIEN
jgi:hypothetical protein